MDFRTAVGNQASLTLVWHFRHSIENRVYYFSRCLVIVFDV